MRDAGLRERYGVGLRSDDPCERAVAAEMLRRVDRAARRDAHPARQTRDAGAWGHVPLAGLLAALGAAGVDERGERVQSGHDWAHRSKSGACLVAWPADGRWWCSSCRRSGDVVGLVRDALGLTYDAAVDWLTARYGPPLERHAARRTPRPYDPAAHVVALGGAGRE